ncbi:Putative alpha/beta hydrolase-1, peptidase S33 tripeptidyl aminopeptidase-like protein [Septoria linicola]|uniref:Alpha/beta hydrolase-1, peptidase S33 tripeptidyl aminopeptidase-like protein n=1 Tax=Septoria linicola TaxID=215465 RepID=A0A9Q9ENS2_9PEZI|nr:putative alpha/beta hydrolase-1, peptidase S33 tripeptidyl aminopeptidase-like protein [Septoria linicola]USW56909.1 Putative alpha/beta hydrolase-1, peptidase S33 tripeptidyl aminopeptidase-like protein [Septoria linicola]
MYSVASFVATCVVARTAWAASEVDWSSITASSELKYTSCYDGLECARLDVPLDWNDSNNAGRVAIAVARLPAKVPVTDPRYGGAIIINPGGPGESGIDEVIDRGRAIQVIVDAASPPVVGGKLSEVDSRDKYFDIIGFDPRGVKYTTPHLHCFPDAFKQQLWLLGYTDYALMWESDASIGLEFARTRALGHSCAATTEQSINRYTNTAQVVEDVLVIVEKHGKWREGEAHKLQQVAADSHHQVILKESHANSANDSSKPIYSKYRPGEERLQYWGVSYGTLLGQTFATMHPDRVGRMVIDGVLDPHDYYNGKWLANLQDSDQIMRVFCELCFEAGPSKCSMYAGNSAADIEREVSNLVLSFQEHPMAAFSRDLAPPQIVSYTDVYLQAMGAMHAPFARAEGFFELLAELKQGNASRIALQKAAQMESTASLAICADKERSQNGCFPEHAFGLLTSTPVIECMDSASSGNRNLTIADFQAYYTELTAQSKWLAASWARHRMSCVGMVDEPVWQYKGPIAGKTSHPLLIIGNTHDTVTPLGNARKVAGLFPGSTVLQHGSEGHCSHANPSLCTATKVREYFQTGQLPDTGTVCQPEYRPFVGYSSRALDTGNLTHSSHADIWKALKRLSEPRTSQFMM